MSRLNELHDSAMDFADQAFIARHRGNSRLADELSRKALESESAAAELVKNDLSAEPTRSVLYRSAASMAIECGEIREAERLIATALTGNPPTEIADELRDLLEQANFGRHLRLQNVVLDMNELQLSIVGSAVGYGIALSEVFVERIKDFERLIYRTVERKLGREFRERGAARRPIQEGYSLFIAAPRPASFAVTLRLGRQMELPGFDLSGEVIDEILECLELINTGQEDKLQQRIPQEAYYQNFIGLVKRIAPDGEKVSMVGLTRVKDGQEVRLAVTRKQNDISFAPSKIKKGERGKQISVTGRLLLADARRAAGRIQLIDNAGNAYNVVVPEGMMDDIVRPLWDEVVVVTGTRSGSKIYLNNISRATE